MDRSKQNILSDHSKDSIYNFEIKNKLRSNSKDYSEFSCMNNIQLKRDKFDQTLKCQSDSDNPASIFQFKSQSSQDIKTSCHLPEASNSQFTMKNSVLCSKEIYSNQYKKQVNKGIHYNNYGIDNSSVKSESLWSGNVLDLNSINDTVLKSNTCSSICQSECTVSSDQVAQTSNFHCSLHERNEVYSKHYNKRTHKNDDEDIDIETKRKDTLFSFKSLNSCKRNIKKESLVNVLPEIRTLYCSKFENQDKLSNEYLSVKFSNDAPECKFSSPFDAVLYYRQDMEKLSEQYVSKIYVEIKSKKMSLKDLKHSKASDFFSNNLSLQLKQFEKVISDLKVQLSSACTLNLEKALKLCEKIKKDFLLECKLLDNFFPSYAFRDCMLNSLKNNQVTIIDAPIFFCFNMILPLLIRRKFPENFIISCESCEFLKIKLSKWLSNFLRENVETDLCHGKLLVNAMFCITEKQMLDSFVNYNFVFNQAVCIIFNLPLVRSIECELILANFQEMLKLNKDSKLILLTSPYSEFNIYQKYFSQMKSCGVSILKAENINFPVTTIWKNDDLTPLDNYVSQVVKTILAILTLQGNGDILAFLPDFNDLQKAKNMLNDKLTKFYYEVECLLVYENASYILNFESVSNSKKYIFLASSCAESTFFPSVKFVVDCGLKQSFFYDSSLKRDVSKITFISQQNAKLRKHMVGNCTSGVCYRIYNRVNYNEDMLQKDFPEILRLNPFNTLIKIFLFRFNNTSKLQFIEFFPEKILFNTMQDLKKYGALKDLSVTSMGKNMSKLPFEGKYSKVILLGLERGLAFEAIVLVAFFCNKENIFLCSNKERHQLLIDAVKLQLTLNDSDTFTYLYIFKNWMDAAFSSEWCENHHIKLNVMKNIHLSVTEICCTVNDCLGENIHQAFSDFQNCYFDLTEILLECFHHNLCVYSGHSKCGYRVLSTSSIAFTQPASVIFQMENPPQFVLYDHIVCSGENTLFHVTAVPSDVIMKALSNNILQFDCNDLFDKTLMCRIIEPVGQELMNEMLLGTDGKKLKVIEEQIRKESGSNLIFIDLSVNKGCVYIYALPDYINFAQCAVEDILKCKFDNILHEHHSQILELQYEQNKVYFEINWSKGAAAITLVPKSQNESKNMFQQDIRDSNISTSVNDVPYFPYQLCLAWIRRPSSGEAYVTYKDEENFMSARKLALKYILIFGFEVFIQVSNKKENQLLITGLPPETNIAHLVKELLLLSPNSEISDVELKYIPPFKTSDSYILKLKSKIMDICKEFAVLGECDVIIPKPNPKDLDMMIFIYSQEKEALNLIADILSENIVKDKKFITKIIYSVEIKCNKDMCKILRPFFISELKQMEQDLKNYHQSKTDYDIGFSIDLECKERAMIKMSCNNIEILSILQRKINDLIEGELISNRTIKNLQNIFFHGGQVWLSNLAKAENIHIVINNKTKTLILNGTQKACDFVKCQIALFLEDAENNVIRTISLTSVQNSSMLLKAVIREYGVNLESFIELCGLHSALLDIKAHKMLIRGSAQSVEKAEECIKTISENLDIVILNVEQSQEICPVCVCPASNLTFRLEHCGHLYCLECIQALVEQAQFPIHCCAAKCSKELVPKDIKKILNDDSTKIKTLLEKSMKDYLEKNREHVFYCPAPDCQMFFYKVDISDSKLQCPLCKNEICSKCNVIFHQGYTCEMYQNSKKDPDYSFKVWQQKTTKCKQCPRCKTAIEKVSGCNRMRCSSCHGNFCWICVMEFPTEQKVYDHIHIAHRGMLFA